MTIQISIDPSNEREQRYKKAHVQFNPGISKLIFDSVKTMLEKDSFDLFNTRNKLVLEHKISKSNKEIDDLIQMKMKANNQKDSMTKRLNDLTLKNEGKLSKLKALVEANAS
tara:strand:+ start:1277 stop:1612 length:336 start_codon:yes stop_codon:yes gene_type:complete